MKVAPILLFCSILSQMAFSWTPKLKGTMGYQPGEIDSECSGSSCKVMNWRDVCSEDQVIFSQNNDGSFDIIFLNLQAQTSADFERVIAHCQLSLPIAIPDGMQIKLNRLEIAGLADVSSKGAAAARFIQSLAPGRRSIRTETFGPRQQPQDVLVKVNLADEWTRCWEDDRDQFTTSIELTADRGSWDRQQTLIAIDEGAGQFKVRYYYDSRSCSNSCRDDEFKVNGRCVPIGQHCADYNGTDHSTCNNGKDDLLCDWDPAKQICFPEGNQHCGDGYFKVKGQCYRLGMMCDDYNGTSSAVCNNGHDDLLCDWDSRYQRCFPE
jgi:hypothetical protein